MARKSFMTLTINVSKASYKELINDVITYSFETQFDDELMEEHKISIDSVVKLVENNEVFYNKMQKELSKIAKTVFTEQVLEDPVAWELDTITCTELNEIYDRCQELQDAYDHEQEIVNASKVPLHVQNAISMLENFGYEVYKTS
jgi:uncharacterized membrane protein YheB (UPF0754 family)